MPAKQTATKPENSHAFRLPSGLEVRILDTTAGAERSSSGVVSVQLWIRAGAADERENEHGCAHFLEHMLFKPLEPSAGETTPRDLGARVAELGGDSNAYTAHDETVFYVRLPVKKVFSGIQLLLEHIFRGDLDTDELNRERNVVLEEIRQYDDDPGARIMQRALGTLYGDHAYGRPVLGLAREVAQHDVDILHGFHRRYYHRNNAVLVICGPVSARELQQQLTKVDSSARKGKFNSRNYEVARGRETPAVVIERADVSECSLRLSWAIPPLATKESVALDILAACLGQGESSRLVQVLQRRAQLVSDVHAMTLPGLAGGTFMVSAQCPTKTLSAAAMTLGAELQRASNLRLGNDEISAAKAQLRSGLVYRNETVQGQAHAIGFSCAVVGDEQSDTKYLRYLSELTSEDVRAACEKYLGMQHCAIVALAPESEVDRATVVSWRKSWLPRRPKITKDSRVRRISKEWNIYEAQHADGFRLLIRPDHRLPMLAGFMSWPGGARVETERNCGQGALIAALLTRGTAMQSGEEVARKVEGAAAVFSGFCGRQTLGMNLECLSDDRERLLETLLESAQLPAFSESEFEEERRVLQQELIADHDDLGHVTMGLLTAGLYGKHPYGRDRRGTVESLQRINRNQLCRAWKSQYPMGNATLALVGDIDPAEAASLIRRLRTEVAAESGAVVRGPFSWSTPFRGFPRKPSFVQATRKRDQAHLALGYPGVKIGAPESAALEFVVQILAGASGRLFYRLREVDGLVYGVDASATEGVDAGHVTIYAATAQARLGATKKAIDEELSRLLREGPSKSEFEMTRELLFGQVDSGLQRRGRMASSLALASSLDLSVDYYLSAAKRIRKVTAADVRKVTEQVFSGGPIVTSLVAESAKVKID